MKSPILVARIARFAVFAAFLQAFVWMHGPARSAGAPNEICSAKALRPVPGDGSAGSKGDAADHCPLCLFEFHGVPVSVAPGFPRHAWLARAATLFQPSPRLEARYTLSDARGPPSLFAG
jgi:hypothetical protein